jgi:hypothetical protein
MNVATKQAYKLTLLNILQPSTMSDLRLAPGMLVVLSKLMACT